MVIPDAGLCQPVSPIALFPDLGPDLNSAVSSLQIGGEIGVILFGQPQFVNVDSQCTSVTVIGNGKSTRAFWLGATADLLPNNPQTGSYPVLAQAPRNDFYQSMILFQRDIGPPPGAFFLQRLNNYSQGCRSALDRLNYQQLFVPASDQGAADSCRNLVGPSSYGGTDTVLKFNAAERLHIIGPSKIDRSYLSIKPNVSVTVYKQLDCQGNGVILPRPGTSLDSFNLNDYGLGRTARSVKVLRYLSGPAPQSIAVQPGTQGFQVQPKVVETVPLQETAEEQAASALTMAVEALIAPSAPVSTAVVSQPAVSANTTNLAVLYELAGISPAGDDSIIPKPGPVPEAVLRPRSSSSGSTNGELFTPSYQLFSPDTEGQVSSVQLPPDENPAPSSASVTLAPVTLPSEAAQAVEEEEIINDPDSFENPIVGSFRLNYCRLPGEECGKPAAVEWCQAKGYQTATRWALDRNIGSLFPTANIGDGTVCSSFQCSGFRYVSCGG